MIAKPQNSTAAVRLKPLFQMRVKLQMKQPIRPRIKPYTTCTASTAAVKCQALWMTAHCDYNAYVYNATMKMTTAFT